MIHKFKNYNFKHNGKDYLGSGIAFYVLDEYEDGEMEAGFEKAELDEAIGFAGSVKDADTINAMAESVLIALNRDDTLRKMLGK